MVRERANDQRDDTSAPATPRRPDDDLAKPLTHCWEFVGDTRARTWCRHKGKYANGDRIVATDVFLSRISGPRCQACVRAMQRAGLLGNAR